MGKGDALPFSLRALPADPEQEEAVSMLLAAGQGGDCALPFEKSRYAFSTWRRALV